MLEALRVNAPRPNAPATGLTIEPGRVLARAAGAAGS
jgi:hypothetical protein